MTDPRIQTDEPWEPAFQSGAFHIEFTGEAWSVYDAFDNRAWLYFHTDTEAIDACVSLDVASNEGASSLDKEYIRQHKMARASMASV